MGELPLTVYASNGTTTTYESSRKRLPGNRTALYLVYRYTTYDKVAIGTYVVQ